MRRYGIQAYIDYVRDNPKGYWFKRKLFGWGWTPVTWQGWLVTIGLIGLLIGNTIRFNPEMRTDHEVLFVLVPQTILIVLILIAICYATGETPRWQWGIPEKDTTNEHDD